jgi:hypothetical protein
MATAINDVGTTKLLIRPSNLIFQSTLSILTIQF